MAQSPYALISIFVGVKEIDARPVAWDKSMSPTAYVTTCTKCAMLVRFGPSHIRDKGGTKYVQCGNCKTSPPDLPTPMAAPSIVDPIETGKLKIQGARRLA